MIKTILVAMACAGMAGGVWADVPRYKYRVRFTDKSLTAFSIERPEAYLSARALARRERQGIAVDSADLPVCTAYIQAVVREGAVPVCTSKWNNTLLVASDDSLLAVRLARHPFVKAVRRVWTVGPDAEFPRNEHRRQEVKNRWQKSADPYGAAAAQIRLHRGDSLHAAGFRGEGMQIAVIDAGFYNADAVKALKGLRLLGVKDFVHPASDIYAEHNHGRKVLSCLAAQRPHVMVGTAPEASYWLLRSEDDATEQPVEEDYWAAAAEFADSVGVDVVNTSLGYHSFDDAADHYRYRDLDGRVSLMSAAASVAAAKGMLVVVSAGNAGLDTWKKITPPADAEGVLTVGAVDGEGVNAVFSSVGPTVDGRVKPDVMALGEEAAVIADDGSVETANGTSFAAPVFCGLAACLWQACPWLRVDQLLDLLRRSGDRADCPDNIYGYGIVDVWKAYQTARTRAPKTEEE